MREGFQGGDLEAAGSLASLQSGVGCRVIRFRFPVKELKVSHHTMGYVGYRVRGYHIMGIGSWEFRV